VFIIRRDKISRLGAVDKKRPQSRWWCPVGQERERFFRCRRPHFWV